jgi:hypothetical protein
MPMVTDYTVTIEGGSSLDRTFIYLDDGLRNCHRIKFNEPEDRTWDDSMMSKGGDIWMTLASTMLEDVIDILRNEGPVYINYDSEQAWLSTFEEPVGEAE